MTTPTPPRDPSALSTEYHKARKQLMLWAAILLVWEFIGIDLEKAKDADGNVGAFVKSIKSPQAIPWVLLILVGYFLFKCTVEWYQCNATRRGMRVARIDFTSAWLISLLAYALYFGQELSRVQLADRIDLFGWSTLPVIGLSLATFWGAGIMVLWDAWRDKTPIGWLTWVSLVISGATITAMIVLFIKGRNLTWPIYTVIGASVFGLGVLSILKRPKRVRHVQQLDSTEPDS